MKKLIFFMILSTLLSCENTKENMDTKPNNSDKKVSNGDLNAYAKRHIEASLSIDGTEKYSYKILKEDLDGDDTLDAIITVNRYAFALKEAAKKGNLAKQAEIGFMGNYNYVFFFDGALDLISPPIAVPSSPLVPLEIEFDFITSTEYKDLIVNYRIRNSAYKAFFTVVNHTPNRYFEWPLFDKLGDSNSEAFGFKYVESSTSTRKNIQIYKASLSYADTTTNFNVAQPKIKVSKELLFEFFYLASKQNYVTKK